MSQESNHHYTAHEYFYLNRRIEFLEKAKVVAQERDPIQWENLREEYADVCDGQAFIELLETRCGCASENTQTKRGGSKK